MYDYVIVTHVPAFYKVNLYNELSKVLNIYVIFIANDTNEKRASDFTNLNSIEFNYKILSDGCFQSRSAYQNIKKLKNILKTLKYKKLLVGGWDLKEFWYLVMSNSKSKNCLALESTILESNTKGIKGFIKKIFLSRISKVFASGKLHVDLLQKLSYKDEIAITKGVGIINKPIFIKEEKVYKKRFLYVGRLAKVKNLKFLITIFNDLPEYKLTLIGEGEDMSYLKSIANPNILFAGTVENKSIANYFLKNDIFILPSLSETWGLVVEEAFYFGLPVIVSQNCGSVELIKNTQNGYIVCPTDKEALKETILKIDKIKYLQLLDGVKKFSLDIKDEIQIGAYL